MKRIFIVLAFLFLTGIAFAGAPPSGPEQYSWPQRIVQPEYKWTVTDYASVVGVCVSAIVGIGGLYLNYRKKGNK